MSRAMSIGLNFGMVMVTTLLVPGVALAGRGGGGGHAGGGGGGFHGSSGGSYHSSAPSGGYSGGFRGGASPGFRASGGFRPSGGFSPSASFRGSGFRASPSASFRGSASPGYHASVGYNAGVMHAPMAGGRSGPGGMVSRTWYHGGVAMNHGYRPFGFGAHSYYAYAPGYRFNHGFYNYLYSPWARPYGYRWGWLGAPWYASYGYYFQPYPSYYGPSYWLTDWMMSDMLSQQYADAAQSQQYAAAQAQTDYDAQAEQQYAEQAQQQEAAPISQDVKEQIRREVDESVHAHEAQQSIDIGTALRDPAHIYAASQTLGVTQAGSNAVCKVTAGDLLRTAGQVAPDAQAVQMVVVSAKKGSCPVGSNVTVSLSDLQGFLNDFSERLEQGMGQMQKQFPASQQDQSGQPAQVGPAEAAPAQSAPLEAYPQQ